VLSFSPLESLLVFDSVPGPKLHEHVAQHLGQESIAVVDLSCGLRALRLEGPTTRELLSKGCGLDLHPDSFPAGRCTRTRLASFIAAILSRASISTSVAATSHGSAPGSQTQRFESPGPHDMAGDHGRVHRVITALKSRPFNLLARPSMYWK
jgi:hypothetical protein